MQGAYKSPRSAKSWLCRRRRRYDAMCRRDELVSLRIEDLADAGDGSGSVLIRRSKADTAGEGGNGVSLAVDDAVGGRVVADVSIEIGAVVRARRGARFRGRCPYGADRDRGAPQGGAVGGVAGGGVAEDFGAFGAGGGSSGSTRAQYRYGVADAGRAMEGYEDTDAVR